MHYFLEPTEIEREKMEDCGRLAAFIEELESLYYEGFAEDLQRDDDDAFTERFRSFINQ